MREIERESEIGTEERFGELDRFYCREGVQKTLNFFTLRVMN